MFYGRTGETCFTLAEIAETEQGMGNQEHAAKSLAHAERGYATIIGLISDPKHNEQITGEEHEELSSGIERLRVRLDKLAPK